MHMKKMKSSEFKIAFHTVFHHQSVYSNSHLDIFSYSKIANKFSNARGMEGKHNKRVFVALIVIRQM